MGHMEWLSLGSIVEGAMGKFQLEDFQFEYEKKEKPTEFGKSVEEKKAFGLPLRTSMLYVPGV